MSENGYKFELKDMDLYYDDFKVLEDVDLDIRKCCITAIIGPSGCGKSSALRCLNRMNDLVEGARLEGRVALDGEDIYDRDYSVVGLR